MTEFPSIRVGIVGAGRAGSAVGSALRAVGHEVVGVSARSEASKQRADLLLPGVPIMSPTEVVQHADVVVIAVPDGAIETVADALPWRAGQTALHLSGATSIHALDAAAAKGAIVMSLHPAMTFTGTSLDVQRLAGAPIAVTASPLYLPVGHALAIAIGGEPFDLADDAKPAYHAALAHASNHLVTLIAQAQSVLQQINVPNRVLRPLTEAALDGALENGMGAITGPVARGDWDTVRRHEAALEAHNGHNHCVLETYRALSEATSNALQEEQCNPE